MSNMNKTTTTAREKVQALPAKYDQAIMSAMENTEEMGLREESEDGGEAFWSEVFAQVMA